MGLLLARQHTACAGRQRLHFKLAGHHLHRRDEGHLLRQVLRHILRVGKAAGQDDPVDLPVSSRRPRAEGFRRAGPSTILPSMNNRTDAPPPRCSTMKRHTSSGLCITSLAQRMAMARQLRAWPTIQRFNMGIPVMRLTGVISSTATGEYT